MDNDKKHRGAADHKPPEETGKIPSAPPLVHDRQLLKHFPQLGYVSYNDWIGIDNAGGYDSWRRRDL